MLKLTKQKNQKISVCSFEEMKKELKKNEIKVWFVMEEAAENYDFVRFQEEPKADLSKSVSIFVKLYFTFPRKA